MVSKDLVNWVRNAEEKGYSRDEIKKMLTKHGHDDHYIDKAISFSKPRENEKIKNIVSKDEKSAVDKIGYFFNTNKKYILIALGIVIIAIILILVLGQTKQIESTSARVPQQIDSPPPVVDPVVDTPIETQEVSPSTGEEAGVVEDRGIIQDEVMDEVPSVTEEIVIQNFVGIPSDLQVSVGTTVRIKNEHTNYKHIIGIREWTGNEYAKAPLDDWNILVTGEHYDYTFDRAGEYLWMSKSSYPRTQGQIKVS